MPYRATAAYLPRQPPRLHLLPAWQLALAGLPVLPAPLYMSAILALPVFEYNVLLLQASAAMPAPLLAGGVAVIIGVVGWLLSRTIKGFDDSVKESKEAMLALSKALETISKEQTASSKLQEYMEKRINVLERKKEVLEKSFAEMDKLIAVAVARKNDTL